MQTIAPSAGKALAAGAQAQAQQVLTHSLKVVSGGAASSTNGTPTPGILHTFASLPPVSTSSVKPAFAQSSSDQRLLTNSVESNLTSSEIICGTTLLRQLFRPDSSERSVARAPAGRAETHIERVVREGLQAPLDGSRSETHIEQVVRHSLKDPIEGFELIGEPDSPAPMADQPCASIKVPILGAEKSIGIIKIPVSSMAPFYPTVLI